MPTREGYLLTDLPQHIRDKILGYGGIVGIDCVEDVWYSDTALPVIVTFKDWSKVTVGLWGPGLNHILVAKVRNFNTDVADKLDVLTWIVDQIVE